MKNTIAIVILLLGLVGTYAGVRYMSEETNSNTLEIDQIISVYDGDTFKVNLKNTQPLFGDTISIRLNGIDTPEIRGSSPCEKVLAYEAKDFVSMLLANADCVILRNPQRGKYFRIIADVEVDGNDLSELLLTHEYARPYDGGTKDTTSWCD